MFLTMLSLYPKVKKLKVSLLEAAKLCFAMQLIILGRRLRLPGKF
jgi:hypothetical protein